MRLTRSDLRLIQEGLQMVMTEAQLELEYENDEAILRWARETEEQAIMIDEKIQIIVDTLTNLHKKDVSADVLLAPGLLSDP